jgi:hypothetical protein
VGGFVQNGGAGEANHENHEDTEKQRCHRAGYLAPHTLNDRSGPNCSRVHRRSPDYPLAA